MIEASTHVDVMAQKLLATTAINHDLLCVVASAIIVQVVDSDSRNGL